MPPEIEPPELRALIDTAERPRVRDWSLRAALTRYGQGQPQRASDVIDLVRRIEWALKPSMSVIEKRGPEVWAAMHDGPGVDGLDGAALPLLRCLAEIDRLGDALARWAVDRADPRPDNDVDAVVASANRQLDDLGVGREEDPRRPRNRGV